MPNIARPRLPVVRICCISLCYAIVNWIYFGRWLDKYFEDVTLDFRKPWWTCFTINTNYNFLNELEMLQLFPQLIWKINQQWKELPKIYSISVM